MSPDDEMINLKRQCVTPLLNCPQGKTHKDCPFAPIRTMEIVKSIHWLKQRSAKELRGILAHHRECSTKPESLAKVSPND